MSEYGELIAPGTVRFERLLPGPIERVWEYLTDAEKRGLWLGSGQIPSQVGGTFETRFDNSSLGSHPAPPPERYKQHGGTHIGKHKVTKFQPPRLLGFTWDETSGDASSEVLFELTPKGDQVLLTVTHMRLPTGKDLLNVSGGWHTHLDLLADILSGRDSGHFWAKLEKVNNVYESRQ